MSKKTKCIFPWSHRWERTTGRDGRIYRFCHKCKRPEVMGDPEQDGTNLIGMEVWEEIPENEYDKQCLPILSASKARNITGASIYEYPLTVSDYEPTISDLEDDNKLTNSNKAKEVFWTKVFPDMFPLEKDYKAVQGMSYDGSMLDKFIDDIYKDVKEN